MAFVSWNFKEWDRKSQSGREKSEGLYNQTRTFPKTLLARVSCEVYVNTNNRTIVHQDCYPEGLLIFSRGMKGLV
nr:hypothetical protein CFP56_57120 [Quercus suber]